MSQKFKRGTGRTGSVFGTVFAIALLLLVGLFIWSEKDHKHFHNDSNHSVMTKAEIEGIVKEYIMTNPKIVIEAMEKFYVEKANSDKDASKKNIILKIKELEEDASDPRAGNGKVKIVEFFDYNCGFCRQMSEVKARLLATNKNIQLVFKETPVLSVNSVFAAKAALAVNKINKAKYLDFQSALLRYNGEVNEAAVEDTITKLGLNWEHVKKEMADKSIQAQLEKNAKLAHEIGVQGTPAYVIAGELIAGRVSFEELQKRAESKN